MHTESGYVFRRDSDVGLAEAESLSVKEDDRAVLLDGGAIKPSPYGARIPPSFSNLLRFIKETMDFSSNVNC